MGITNDGWFDWAARVHGPSDKVYSARNTVSGVIPHSMVGYYPAWLDRLMDRERTPDGRYTAYAAASIHGAILYNGELIQHYPLTASCWGSGSRFPNTHFVAFEFEGGPPDNLREPLRPPQAITLVRIIEETSEWRGWIPRRSLDVEDKVATLYEHNECTRWGSGPTACPSGRIPWSEILQLLEEDDMKPYLAREEDLGFTWIIAGNIKTYLHAMEDAYELGIDMSVKIVPAGTLKSLGRVY